VEWYDRFDSIIDFWRASDDSDVEALRMLETLALETADDLARKRVRTLRRNMQYESGETAVERYKERRYRRTCGERGVW
jgi:hypothetical protein